MTTEELKTILDGYAEWAKTRKIDDLYDLTGKDFANADMHGVKLPYSDFDGSIFTGANLEDTDFSNSTLRGTRMDGPL